LNARLELAFFAFVFEDGSDSDTGYGAKYGDEEGHFILLKI